MGNSYLKYYRSYLGTCDGQVSEGAGINVEVNESSFQEMADVGLEDDEDDPAEPASDSSN